MLIGAVLSEYSYSNTQIINLKLYQFEQLKEYYAIIYTYPTIYMSLILNNDNFISIMSYTIYTLSYNDFVNTL